MTKIFHLQIQYFLHVVQIFQGHVVFELFKVNFGPVKFYF